MNDSLLEDRQDFSDLDLSYHVLSQVTLHHFAFSLNSFLCCCNCQLNSWKGSLTVNQRNKQPFSLNLVCWFCCFLGNCTNLTDPRKRLGSTGFPSSTSVPRASGSARLGGEVRSDENPTSQLLKRLPSLLFHVREEKG